MGHFITQAALHRLASTAALALILSGCSTVVPMVADRMAQFSQDMMADEDDEAGGHDLKSRAGDATAAGRYGEAEAYLEAALSVDPHDDQALRQLAVIYRLTGRPEQALSFEQMAGDLDTADAVTWIVSETASNIPDDANNVERFVVLKRLYRAELVSEEDYEARREANLGALLPLTYPAPALDASRTPPRGRDVVERLDTITRFRDIGVLNDDTYKLERNAILDGLMPLPASQRETASALILEALDPEAHQLWLDRLLDIGLITPREYNDESAVLVGVYTPAAGSMDNADSAPSGSRLSMNDRPFTVMDEAAMARDEEVMISGGEAVGDANLALGRLNDNLEGGGPAAMDETQASSAAADSITRINIHLALSRTPESARRSWEELQEANGLALDGLIPRVSRVDLGGGKGVFFQLSAGPLANMAAAEALCDELLKRDFYCAPLVF